MNAGIIGYRNHSARVAKLISEIGGIDRFCVYHPDPDKLAKVDVPALFPDARPTSELSDLYGLDAVFITSPNDTHVGYVKRLVDRVGYVYSEKPPAANLDELEYLRSLDATRKLRLYFNFNYRFSDLAVHARDLIRSGDIGEPIRFSFVSTHGLAFRESFKEDWRSHSKDPLSGIFGNVSIHYIDLCLWLLGTSEKISSKYTAWSPYSGTTDSVSTEMQFANGCTASIFVSYAAPFINEAQLIFTDGFLQLQNGSLHLYRPRDSHDEAGRFISPPGENLLIAESSRSYYDRSMRRSLDYFISVASSRGEFDTRDFDLTLESNAAIFAHA